MPPRRLIVLVLFCMCTGIALPLLAFRLLGLGDKTVELSPIAPEFAPVVQPTVATPTEATIPSHIIDELPTVWVSGYISYKGRLNVVLSDGRTLTEHDSELQELFRNSATIDGRRVFLKPPGSGAKGAPVSQDAEAPGVAITDRTGHSGAGGFVPPALHRY